MKSEKRRFISRNFMQKIIRILKDVITSLCILAIAALCCCFMNINTNEHGQVSLVFVLAVLIISRVTSGYACGILSSIVSVFFINFVFTYPYYRLNFTLSGYPLTFVAMFTVTITVSALTSRVKLQEKVHLESEKEKLRANLLRAVSHDIRTPLTSINGSAAAIIESGDKMSQSERTRLIESISEESSNLIKTVENLLSVTKINGKANISKADEMVEEVVSESVSRFKKYHPDVEVKVALPEFPLFVPMDGLLIEQVLINLMDNAVIHGSATTITISIYEKEGFADFEVSDNGTGVANDALKTIESGNFSFESENISKTRRNMGIGLSVCESIINAHNGKIRCVNTMGQGAKFAFTLPLN